MRAQSHACAAKAGVDMITRTLALEWGPRGIRVNGIVPGVIGDTEGTRRFVSDAKVLERVLKAIPLQRLGTTDDIANLCLFLSSEFGAYVYGAIIPVDGGWMQEGARGLALD